MSETQLELVREFARKYRQQNTDQPFDKAEQHLVEGWLTHAGENGLAWKEVRAVVREVWESQTPLAAEKKTNAGELRDPPTFLDDGPGSVVRGRDESNL